MTSLTAAALLSRTLLAAAASAVDKGKGVRLLLLQPRCYSVVATSSSTVVIETRRGRLAVAKRRPTPTVPAALLSSSSSSESSSAAADESEEKNDGSYTQTPLDTTTSSSGSSSGSPAPPRTKTTTTKRRNPALTEVIREGLGSLNQSALLVQQAKRTHRPLFRDSDGSGAGGGDGGKLQQMDSSPQLLAEGHRLFEVANDCLEEYCRTSGGSGGPGGTSLTIRGEPILLLHVDVRPSMQQATVFWTVPVNVLLDDNLTFDQKVELQDAVHERMITNGTPWNAALRKLQRKVSAALRHHRSPRLRWEPATDVMVSASLQQLTVDDDELFR